MKKSTRRTMMMSSLAMLLVAVLALGTATYAWFTAASTGRIQNIQFTATSADGISLSTSGLPGTYRSTLDFTDYYTDDVVLSPVSIANASNANFTAYSGFFDEDTTTISTSQVSSPNGNYIIMPVYIWNSGSSDITVYLSEVAIEALGSIRTDLATRVGVVAYNNTVAYDSLTSASNMDTIFTTFGSSFIYEPNADAHLDESIQGAQTYYAVVSAQNAQATQGSNNHIIADGQPALSSSTAVTAKTCGPTNTPVVTVAGGNVMKVFVYVWIEGQDVDCFNEIAAGQVKLEIVFAK